MQRSPLPAGTKWRDSGYRCGTGPEREREERTDEKRGEDPILSVPASRRVRLKVRSDR